MFIEAFNPEFNLKYHNKNFLKTVESDFASVQVNIKNPIYLLSFNYWIKQAFFLSLDKLFCIY